MQAWEKRAVEEANLFNPAFCAALLAKTTDDYRKKSGQLLPFALSFLVLPIVLHRQTRLSLPGTTLTSLLPWIQDNRDGLVDFPKRVSRLRGITREALLFGAQHQTLVLTGDGCLKLGSKHRSATERRTSLFTDEARQCVDRAGFLGRWFSSAGTIATIYAAWEVAP